MSTPHRRERLLQLLELLRSSRKLTSADIAATLKVSRRTVFRDIRELQNRGVNVVWSEESQAYHLEITSEVPDFDDDPDQFGTRPMQMVRIWFHQHVVPTVTEHAWIKSNKTEVNADGSIIVELRVSRFDDIIRWILRFGDRAKVLEPVEFRKQLLDWLDSLRKIYDDDSA